MRGFAGVEMSASARHAANDANVHGQRGQKPRPLGLKKSHKATCVKNGLWHAPPSPPRAAIIQSPFLARQFLSPSLHHTTDNQIHEPASTFKSILAISTQRNHLLLIIFPCRLVTTLTEFLLPVSTDTDKPNTDSQLPIPSCRRQVKKPQPFHSLNQANFHSRYR